MGKTRTPLFVGRIDELERWKAILRDDAGQAVLVSGPSGMGKTSLLDKMAEIAREHPDLVCGAVRYEVTESDSPDAIMELMMDNAFDAAQAEPGSFDKTDQRKAQWRAIAEAAKLVPVVGQAAVAGVGLVQSLQKRNPQKNTREQFMDRLRLISKRMPENGRAVFVLDPEKYVWKGSADAWRIVMRDLPPKIMFVFAQRSEDELAESAEFRLLENVVDLCGGELATLGEADVEAMADAAARVVAFDRDTLLPIFKRYNGHPYALAAAVDLLRDGLAIDKLPNHSEPKLFAKLQWDRVCKSQHGERAIALLQSYAIAGVAIPSEIAQRGADLTAAQFKAVRADAVVGTLLRHDGENARIYHAILADFIREQIGKEEARPYHERIIAIYRERMGRTPADMLAAKMLPFHVGSTEGTEQAIVAFISECSKLLMFHGELSTIEARSHLILSLLDDSKANTVRATVLSNLGLVYMTRGDLSRAEEMFHATIAIYKEVGHDGGLAGVYSNLGLISQTRGDLKIAEELILESQVIEEALGNKEGMARNFGNLGMIYRRRNDLESAEKLHCKALAIHEELGQEENMASDYGNLGVIYQTRGDLDGAEAMHRKALAIEEKLGRKEGIASEYGNLGLLYQNRGDLKGAEMMHLKSLEIELALGHKEGISNQFGSLGLLYQKSGNLKDAEMMHLKSLAIAEELGNKEGVAREYGNLGGIYCRRGDLDHAEEAVRKSLAINEELGSKGGMAKQFGNLGMIYHARGNVSKAKESWQQALELFAEVGKKPEMERVREQIEDLANVAEASPSTEE